MVNESYSLKGYKFKTWLFKNKESVKLLIAGTMGLVSALVSGLPAQWSVPLGSIIGIAIKILVDGIDYWQSE